MLKKGKIKKGITSLFSSNRSGKKKEEIGNPIEKNIIAATPEVIAESSTSSIINSQQLVVNKQKKEKTILLIGSTGKGKSALANVITDTNKFKESAGSTSETREIQSERFKENDITYRIVDTVGLSDTKISRNEVLDKIAEAVYLLREGVSQVLFVIDGRFDQKEIANYDLLKTIIFDEQVINYTTIIRTRFESFQDKDKCEDDIRSMLEESEELAEILQSCKKRIIHVNNPSLNLIAATNEDESKRKKREEKISKRKEERNSSRKLLLEHLQEICESKYYKPPKLTKLSKEIVEYMKDKMGKKEELAKKKEDLGLEEIEEQITSSKVSSQKEVIVESITETKTTNTEKFLVKNKDKKEEGEIQLIYDFKSEAINLEKKIRSQIKKLEDELKEWKEIKKLKEEIQELEENIRRKVREHILNNQESIGKVNSGHIFLNIIEDKDNSSYSEKNILELNSDKKEREAQLSKKNANHSSLKSIEEKIQQKEKELEELKNDLLIINKLINMTEEKMNRWQEKKFDVLQALEWGKVLGESFNPQEDIEFCAWLKDVRKLISSSLPIYNLNELKSEYIHWLQNHNQHLEMVNQQFIVSNAPEISEQSREAQEYLNNLYPKKLKQNITELDISGWDQVNWKTKPNWEKLKGTLDLSDFINLKKLYCSHNQLTELNVSNCVKLVELHCFNNNLIEIKFNSLPNLQVLYAWTNRLSELNWDGLNSQILTKLSLSNNNFFEQNLSFIERFSDLTELYLGNDIQEKIDLNIKNRFYGSLESLKNLTKLKVLQVEGLEISNMANVSNILPNIEKFIFWDKKNIESMVKILGLTEEETRKIRNSNPDNIWKIFNEIVVNRNKEKGFSTKREQEIDYLEKRIESLNIIKDQKDKNIKSFLNLSLEKDLTQELIFTYLKLTRYKKQELDSIDYDERVDEYEDICRDIKKQLRSKLNKETMNNIQVILNDCEQLVEQEIELKELLNKKHLLIESYKDKKFDNNKEKQLQSQILFKRD